MSDASQVAIPGLKTVTATEIDAPPAWALMERQLIGLMEQSAELFTEKYCRPSGNVYYVQDVDDVYEIFSNWGLFYSMGADSKLLDWALRAWNATTRYFDDATRFQKGDPVHPNYRPQLHNEYYNADGPADWFHMGEGNQAFYDFGLADPTLPEMVVRARRFAGLYTGDDPDVRNYDPVHKIIRSPYHGSEGPMFHAPLERVKALLDPLYRVAGQTMGHAQRSNLHPIVKDLEEDWYENPERREEIVKLFDEIVLNGDVADNLAATGLATHAYLYTGDDKYKRWVLEYVDAWMDRMRANGGIVPDNVGPTGKVGEQRQGQWWGGLYGWNSRWSGDHLFIAITIAAECALLLTGDYGYLDLLRSQIELQIDNAKTREDGQLLVPTRMTPEGWSEYQPMKVLELAHLYHASMDQRDYDLLARLRAGEVERDWSHVKAEGGRRGGDLEFQRFQYYDGKYPDWPTDVLRAEYKYALAQHEAMRQDSRDFEQIVADNRWPPSYPGNPDRTDYGGENADPIRTNGLTHVMLGAPRTMYNGGLLRAAVRYFDADNARPGLPSDVAALVDELKADRAGINLVNLSSDKTRKVVVQAGAFGEHQFTELRTLENTKDQPVLHPGGWINSAETLTEQVVPINAKYFAVELPPATTIRVEAGMKRFANRPSYAFPWHGDSVPIT